MVSSTAGWICRLSLPFLPSIVSNRSLKETLVLAGMEIGFFPTRDITSSLARSGGTCAPSSADGAQDLAADILLARLFVRHHPARRGQDGNPHPVQHGPEVLALHVRAPARPADPLQAVNGVDLAGPVFQVDAQDSLLAVLQELVVLDEPL